MIGGCSTRLGLRIALTSGILFSAALTVAGCASGGLVVPQEAFKVTGCPNHPAPYPVSALAKEAKSHCDLQGGYVRYPNGYSVEIPQIGDNVSVAGADGAKNFVGIKDTYLVFNFGRYGVIAGQRSHASNRSSWWGSPSALKAYQAAHGKIVPSSN